MNLEGAYDAAALTRSASRVLAAAGLACDRADAIAAILVEGDLLGHHTHGLALLDIYLREIASGNMTVAGEPETVADHGAAITWNGRRLPGPWLVLKALDLAAERARRHGTGTVVIGQSHHIACLAAYLKRAADRGLAMILTSSAPSTATVAPHGGAHGVISPNPVAAGFPTERAAVLVDVSTSATANTVVTSYARLGTRLPHPWLIDTEGRISDDPTVLTTPGRGAILPLGGLDNGHKGFGLGLMVEALTSGLAGNGRTDRPQGLCASVFLQVLDPSAFGGLAAFRRETQFLADACHAVPPVDSARPVRLPGEGGFARWQRQSHEGITLAPETMAALRCWADRLGVTLALD